MPLYTDYLILKEQSSVPTPGTGEGTVYVGTDGKLKTKDDTGTITGPSLQESVIGPFSTASIAADVMEEGETTGILSFQVFKIEVSFPARVRLYNSVAARDADSSRGEGIPASPGAKPFLEVITTIDDEIIWLTPIAQCRLVDSVTFELPYAITNKDTTSRVIAVTLDIIQIGG